MTKFRSSILASIIFLSIGQLSLSMENSDFSSVEKFFKNPSSLRKGSEKIPADKITVRREVESKPRYVITDSSLESLEEIQEGLTKLVQTIKERDDEFEIEWSIFSNNKPNDLGKILEGLGFSYHDVLAVMAYDLQQNFEAPFIDINEAINVEILADKSLIPAWASIVGIAFKISDYCNSETYHKCIEAGIDKLSNQEYYAAYYNDQLAATGAMRIIEDEGIGIIFAGTTHPDFGKKGLATAISLFILKRAKELGLKFIVFLTSNDYIFKICEKGQCTKVFDNYRYRVNYPSNS